MKNNKKTIKTDSFNEVFKKDFSSGSFRKIYNEELAMLQLAEQIRNMRIASNLTQKTVSEKTKMPQSVIARIESGTHSYSLGTLYKIAHVFNKEIKLV